MQEYEVTNADGIVMTVQLDEHEARKRGLSPKPAAEPDSSDGASGEASKETNPATTKAAETADATKKAAETAAAKPAPETATGTAKAK